MSLLDEQLVEEWLNRHKFFTMRGIKCGVDEIDLLALRENPAGTEYWHVEVQISFNPIGYIGGGPGAKKKPPEEVEAGVVQWVDKKFRSAKKIARRDEISPHAKWKFVLVHGIVKYRVELDLIRSLGVETMPYHSMLEDLIKQGTKGSSSIATNILDILKFAKGR